MLINMMSKAINLLQVLIWKNVLELAKKRIGRFLTSNLKTYEHQKRPEEASRVL